MPPRTRPKVPAMKSRDLRVARIRVVLECDIYENNKKIEEAVVDPTDENGTRPYVFYSIDDLLEWAKGLPAELNKAKEVKTDA